MCPKPSLFISPTKLAYVTTNKTGYIILYCDRFIILFTQIIKNKQIIKKENIFTLSVQYLEKYQLHHCCFYACFWTSWAWNKDTVLLYSIQYCTVKYTKAQPSLEDAYAWQCAWTNSHDRTCEHTFSLLESSQLEGLYVADLLYRYLKAIIL